MNTTTMLVAGLLAIPFGTILLANQGPESKKDTPVESQIPADTEIQTTESGLKYSILQPGNGETFPLLGDKVRVHYTGWLTNGTKFDSSRDRGEPSDLALGAVIEGWTEGLQMMSPGAKYKFTIPSALGYGETGTGNGSIPPNSELIFEVELFEIVERAMPYVDWVEERETKDLEGGGRYQVLQAGDGASAGDSKFVFVEFARYGADKKITLGSTMTGLLIGPPNNPNIKFYEALLKTMKVGDHVLLEVPKALDIQTGEVKEGEVVPETTMWQVAVREALNCETPEFAMPAEEELTTTASGLKYKVIREGVGSKPTKRSRCNVHYSGWLTDGTPFDSSYTRGQPAAFGVTQVISGWTEGLQLMREGAMYTFVIPGDLAYKAKGSPPTIGPNATLVFTVELLNSQP